MIINSHSAKNFRNIESLIFVPHPEMNVIYGENGQGKTNIIESIWLMTGFYSFRARKNSQLIADGKQQAEIECSFFSDDREQSALMKIGKRKEIILNGVYQESPRIMMGKFYAVVFSPNTLGIVQDGPGERRKTLDIAISLIKPNYAVLMSRYLRVLEQRNALLKKYNEKQFDLSYFEPWDNELISLGARLIKYRLDYVDELSKTASKIYEGISSGREQFEFHYDFMRENSNLENITAKLRESFEKSKESDFRRTYTNVGPHSDDLILYLNGKEARVYGSQGQQRSCALAIKLAEASVIKQITGNDPVVLLDDVMSELDERRQSFILNFLDDRQVFITCCDPSQLLRSKRGKAFEVKNGVLEDIS